MELGIAIAGFALAAVSIAIALISADAARKSAGASQDSASAAGRSATAAEGSLEIQKREAAAREEALRRSLMADVVPLYWESSGGQTHRGLVVRNNGPALASEISAYEVLGGRHGRVWLWAALARNETVGLAENSADVTGEDAARLGLPSDAESGDLYALIEWTNADGGRSSSGWRHLSQLQRDRY